MTNSEIKGPRDLRVVVSPTRVTPTDRVSYRLHFLTSTPNSDLTPHEESSNCILTVETISRE